jgi:GTP-binding protein LepA
MKNDLKNFLELTELIKHPKIQSIKNKLSSPQNKTPHDSINSFLEVFFEFNMSRSSEHEILDLFESHKATEIFYQTKLVSLKDPSNFPELSSVDSIFEPFTILEIIVPEEYTGDIISLISECRGTCLSIGLLSMGQIQIKADIPLAEIITDFYDKLKSVTRGYASMSYGTEVFKKSDLVKIDILLNSKVISPFSHIVHKDKSEIFGRKVCAKLKELIPRQQIEIIIQAAISSKVIARETIKPFRKDVTAKLYGGDISRRMKLLDKQKEGKKKMRGFGNVNIPKEAFLNLLQN